MKSEIQGWMLEEELDWLAYMASISSNILEIGAWKGRSTKILCDYGKGKVTTIDNFLGDPDNPNEHVTYTQVGTDNIEGIFRENLKDHLESGKLTLIKGNSYKIKFPGPFDVFDFIFIDGGHTYSTVFGDILNAMNLIKSKGIISGHDRELPGVSQAVKELLGEVSLGPGSIWYKVYNN